MNRGVVAAGQRRVSEQSLRADPVTSNEHARLSAVGNSRPAGKPAELRTGHRPCDNHAGEEPLTDNVIARDPQPADVCLQRATIVLRVRDDIADGGYSRVALGRESLRGRTRSDTHDRLVDPQHVAGRRDT